MNTILTFLLAYGLLAVLYRFAVRPLFWSAMCERIAHREKDLGKMAAEGTVSTNDFSYQFLMKRFQIKHIPEACSVSALLHFLLSSAASTGSAASAEDYNRFQNEASSELQEMFKEFSKDFGLWMLLNSPIYTMIGYMSVVVLILSRKIDETTAKRKSLIFVASESAASAA